MVEHNQICAEYYAWLAGLTKNVTAGGAVHETCEGTNIGQTLDYYVKRGRPGDDPHGRSPVLLAGTEILLAKQK